MSQGDDDAPRRPANPNMPPRPGTPGPAKPPPPVPTAAKPSPPPAPEANPFLARESTRDIDVGWLAPEDAAEVSLAPPEPDAPPAPAPVATEPAKPGSVAPSESTPAPPPFQKKSRAKVLAFGLLAALLLGGGGFVYQSRVTARSSRAERAAPQPSAEATVEPPAPATVPPPPPTHTAEPPPSASAEKKKKPGASASAGAPVTADPASQGILDTTQLPAGRKIVVDGRVLGTSPRKVAVRCGVHRIQIGDLPPESIELPCGGEVNFTE